MNKFTVTILLLTSLGIGLLGCDNNATNSGAAPTLDAVIDVSPSNPEVGNQVTLDASGSQDDQGIGYTVQWSFESKPSSSSAIIPDPSQSSATFTPDVDGDYVIKLTIENLSEGVSDQAQTTISVTPEPAQTIELSGTIAQDSVLTDIFTDSDQADYLVTDNFELQAKLTVEPGVVIHFQENTGLTVTGAGILVADGATDNRIVFTGESQSINGFWRGINMYSNSVENSISHAEISYGGSKTAATYFEKANLTIDNAKLQMNDVTISHSGGYGIQTRRNGSEFEMQNMTFEANDDAHAYVHISQAGYFDSGSTFDGGYVKVFGGDTSDDMTISKLDGAVFNVLDYVGFNDIVTVDAGARIEFSADAGFKVNDGGVIKAQGTQNEHIEFTGTAQTAGAWKGIFIASSSVDNIMEYVDISYAGSSAIATYFDKAAMGIHSAKINLSNVSITGSAGYGIETRSSGSTFSVENCTFDNNANSHMRIHPEQIHFIDNQTNFNGGDVEVYKGDTQSSGSETWSKLNNGTYYLVQTVDIHRPVTIEAGAQFEMDTNVKLKVSDGGDLNGSINATGTATDRIVFSGRSKAAGAWGGILINSSSVDNTMDYVTIEYGGGDDLAIYMDSGNLGVYNDAYLSISNANIENSASHGIIVRVNRDATLSSSNVSYSNIAGDNVYEY
jgi:hypothetical protein